MVVLISQLTGIFSEGPSNSKGTTRFEKRLYNCCVTSCHCQVVFQLTTQQSLNSLLSRNYLHCQLKKDEVLKLSKTIKHKYSVNYMFFPIVTMALKYFKHVLHIMLQLARSCLGHLLVVK